ncbi:hypothetical protein SEA_SPOOKY_58 [Gordonia phage Spooky]|nr:hypothetical protein SEA_SPOOKY_58 [Gordonia phage Spooky]
MTVVDMDAWRSARDILEIDHDLDSILSPYGFHSSLQVTGDGYAAVVTDVWGRRVMRVEPQKSPWTTRDHVLCWLEAQR